MADTQENLPAELSLQQVKENYNLEQHNLTADEIVRLIQSHALVGRQQGNNWLVDKASLDTYLLKTTATTALDDTISPGFKGYGPIRP